ncbi:hypothetical protein CRUP_005157, partial [Coryphaenoides rupestris]
ESEIPTQWSPANVQKWLLWTEHLYRLPHAGRAFQELSGKDLCAMSEEAFRQRSPQCGDTPLSGARGQGPHLSERPRDQ